MFNEQNHRTIIIKRIGIGVAVAVIVAAVGIGVAMLLRNINNLSGVTPTSSQPTSSAPASPTASSIISDYLTLDTVHTLANNYQIQQDASGGSNIILKGDGQTFVTSVPTSAYALFFASSPSQPNDSQSIIDQTTSFMTNRGFAKVDNPTELQVAPDQTVTTYDHDGAVCQLTSSPTSVPEFYTIACANKSDVTKQYDSIQKLLAIYEKGHSLGVFSRAIATTTTSGNMAMTTISLNVTGSHPILLFASVNNTWQYIGDIGDGATSNGKYSLPPDVQSAIHDPKYGNFLIHNLQG